RVAELAEHDPEGAALFERLRAWRGQVASAMGKPPYTVLHDTTLAAIAEARPKDLRQLGFLRGIGAAKLQAYGPAVLAIVRGEEVVVPRRGRDQDLPGESREFPRF